MHFFVARSVSIAVITETYVRHERNLHLMDRLLYYTQTANKNKQRQYAARVTLSFDACFLENPCEYPQKRYIARN